MIPRLLHSARSAQDIRPSGIEQIGGAVGSTEALRVPWRRARRSAINCGNLGRPALLRTTARISTVSSSREWIVARSAASRAMNRAVIPAREPYQPLTATTMATTRTEYSVGTGIRSLLHSQPAHSTHRFRDCLTSDHACRTRNRFYALFRQPDHVVSRGKDAREMHTSHEPNIARADQLRTAYDDSPCARRFIGH